MKTVFEPGIGPENGSLGVLKIVVYLLSAPCNMIGSAYHVSSCFKFHDGIERVVTVSRGDGTPYQDMEKRLGSVGQALHVHYLYTVLLHQCC